MYKMKYYLPILWGLILALALVSCTPMPLLPTPTPRPSATASQTQAPLPTQTMTPSPNITSMTLTPTIIVSLDPAQANPDEQIYLDPAGWYSFAFPASWKLEEGTNRFHGQDGFVESGTLPEKGYMKRALQVCQWIANVDQKGNAYVAYIDLTQSCLVAPITDDPNPPVIAIVENTNAPLEQRYVYIKTDLAHYASFVSQMIWLQPTQSQIQTLQPILENSADDFWNTITESDIELNIKEYLLPVEAQFDDPGKSIFGVYIPEEAKLQNQNSSGGTHQIPTLELLNESISNYGYEFRKTEESGFYELYLNNTLMVNDVNGLPTVHRFSTTSGERIVFVVDSISIGGNSSEVIRNHTRYLAENDGVIKWEDGPKNSMESGERVLLIDDNLLWARIGDHTNVEIQNTQHEVLFSFSTYFGTHIPINSYQSWHEHWILEISDFVIMDGEILNEKYGYEEIYRWRLINEKPFYLFRKGAHAGISYDDQILPIAYDEIVHGYCCGLVQNNPGITDSSFRFFARKEGYWYYVVIDLSES